MKLIDKEIERCYSLLPEIVCDERITSEEKDLICDSFLYYGRYLKKDTQTYFEQTVFPEVEKAAKYFQLDKDSKVLDLGCGLGMQSVIFASLGAKVIGIDLSPKAIKLAKKLHKLFEIKLNKKLDITYVCDNFLNSKSFFKDAEFSCVFSMSAFSYIQPTSEAISLIESITAKQSRVYLYEENKRSIFGLHRKFKQIPSHLEIRNRFSDYGFNLRKLDGVCAIPSKLWKKRSAKFVRWINEGLTKIPFLSFSYALQLEKKN